MNLVNILEELKIPYNGKDFRVSSFETLKNADASQIAFLNDKKFLDELKNNKSWSGYTQRGTFRVFTFYM